MNSEVLTGKTRRNGHEFKSQSGSVKGSEGGQLRGEQHKPFNERESSSRLWVLNSQGFPPGVTVDELKNYRRRRQSGDARPKDNLGPEEGSLKSYKSEYKRRYGAHDPAEIEFYSTLTPGPSRKKLEEVNGNDIDLTEPVLDIPLNKPILKRPQCNLLLAKDQPMENSTEKTSQYVLHVNPERRKLLRRSTALKPEGELMTETEVRSQFRGYDNPEKRFPIRRSPSLKLEGVFETMTTEQKEKFICHLLDERPSLTKKNTLLKMEGDFDFLTEKQLSYVQHNAGELSRPRKRSTSLKLDGEVEFFPEYRSCFVDFPRSRPITYKPSENLRNEGDIESVTETKTKFVNFREFPVSLPARPSNNLQMEGGFEIRPEYKENFVDFPRSRPFTMRPENQIRQEGDLDLKTEKDEEMSKILNEHIQRPLSIRRPSNLRLEGDFEFSTEKREKFKEHEIPYRFPPFRTEDHLQLEGQVDFKTESEDKYVANPLPSRSDFRRRSCFLHSGGEFRSVLDWNKTSPRETIPTVNRPKPADPRPKVIPFKTLHYDVNEELLENCNRRRNSKRLREDGAGLESSEEERPSPFATFPRSLPSRPADTSASGGYSVHPRQSSSPKRDSPLRDNIRLDDVQQSSCQERKTCDPPFEIVDSQAKDRTKPIREYNSEDSSGQGQGSNPPPSFRLEVYNVDAHPQGFHRGNRRVFPPEGIQSNTINVEPGSFLDRRQKQFDTSVSSPEVPNQILDRNNNLGDRDWGTRERDGSTLGFPDGNGNFSIREKPGSPGTGIVGEKALWSPPPWLSI